MRRSSINKNHLSLRNYNNACVEEFTNIAIELRRLLVCVIILLIFKVNARDDFHDFVLF